MDDERHERKRVTEQTKKKQFADETSTTTFTVSRYGKDVWYKEDKDKDSFDYDDFVDQTEERKEWKRGLGVSNPYDTHTLHTWGEAYVDSVYTPTYAYNAEHQDFDEYLPFLSGYGDGTEHWIEEEGEGVTYYDDEGEFGNPKTWNLHWNNDDNEDPEAKPKQELPGGPVNPGSISAGVSSTDSNQPEAQLKEQNAADEIIPAWQTREVGLLGKAGGFMRGVKNGLDNLVGGTIQSVLHPVDTAKGIWEAGSHPIQTSKAIASGVYDKWNSGYEGKGELFFELGTAIWGTTKARALTPNAQRGTRHVPDAEAEFPDTTTVQVLDDLFRGRVDPYDLEPTHRINHRSKLFRKLKADIELHFLTSDFH